MREKAPTTMLEDMFPNKGGHFRWSGTEGLILRADVEETEKLGYIDGIYARDMVGWCSQVVSNSGGRCEELSESCHLNSARGDALSRTS